MELGQWACHQSKINGIELPLLEALYQEVEMQDTLCR